MNSIDADLLTIDQVPAEQLLPLTTGLDYWSTSPLPSIGLRAIRMADGPHGLRVQDDDAPDHMGLNRSRAATCFPPAVTLASSWDPKLVEQVGAALGAEARTAGADVVLGPGLNIKRSPLCGRNFEYYSEDPLLAGRLAGAMTRGIQSRGVAACLKHFAANNQETDRQRVSAELDPRTLREIYLKAFEIALREGGPWTIMSAYNRINGVYASESSWLLSDVLRGDWGWDGVVISDWGAVHDPAEAINAGLDIRMPGRPGDPRLEDALHTGKLDRGALRRTAKRIALLAERTARSTEHASDSAEHHALTRRAAAESAVLLTNDGALPLSADKMTRIAVIGELAVSSRYQGAGSSAVNPTRLVTGLEGLTGRLGGTSAVDFSLGYRIDSEVDDVLVEGALACAEGADAVIVFAGLGGSAEAEGRDRTTIELPENQIDLIQRLAAAGTRVVVVLANGSAVTTARWRQDAAAIVEFWLTGQAHGETIADVLFGDVAPSGRLAETIPVALEDTSSFLNFPGENGRVLYGEGVFVGYRWYDARRIEVDHAFGHGLSYTSFDYSDLDITVHPLEEADALSVTVTITNTGSRYGAEVPQVYVTDTEAGLAMPERELRGFDKVWLQSGESRRLTIAVRRQDLAHFHTGADDWVHSGGIATVHVGASSRDIRLVASVDLPGNPVIVPLDAFSSLAEWKAHPLAGPALQTLLDQRGGIRGRMGDLLSDPAGADSVLSVPLQTLIEMPGVPIDHADVDALLHESA
ncbi:glycoside hydrolase family 3 C-terminal domain-containing protein [Microbacterium saperdae]